VAKKKEKVAKKKVEKNVGDTSPEEFIEEVASDDPTKEFEVDVDFTTEELPESEPLTGVESKPEEEEEEDTEDEEVEEPEPEPPKKKEEKPISAGKKLTNSEKRSIQIMSESDGIPEKLITARYLELKEDEEIFAFLDGDTESLLGQVRIDLDDYVRSVKIRFFVMEKHKSAFQGENWRAELRGIQITKNKEGQAIRRRAYLSMGFSIGKEEAEVLDTVVQFGIYDVYVGKPSDKMKERPIITFNANTLTKFDSETLYKVMEKEHPIQSFYKWYGIKPSPMIGGGAGCGTSKMSSFVREDKDGSKKDQDFAEKSDPKALLVRSLHSPRAPRGDGGSQFFKVMTLSKSPIEHVNILIPDFPEFSNSNTEAKVKFYYVVGTVQHGKGQNLGEFRLNATYITPVTKQEIAGMEKFLK